MSLFKDCMVKGHTKFNSWPDLRLNLELNPGPPGCNSGDLTNGANQS